MNLMSTYSLSVRCLRQFGLDVAEISEQAGLSSDKKSL